MQIDHEEAVRKMLIAQQALSQVVVSGLLPEWEENEFRRFMSLVPCAIKQFELRMQEQSVGLAK